MKDIRLYDNNGRLAMQRRTTRYYQDETALLDCASMEKYFEIIANSEMGIALWEQQDQEERRERTGEQVSRGRRRRTASMVHYREQEIAELRQQLLSAPIAVVFMNRHEFFPY